MNVKHYFDILDIAPTKDRRIIKKAYRKKALQYHPDRNSSPGAKLKFIEVTEAYDQLLVAVDQAKKQGSTIENATTQRKRHYRPRTPQKSRVQKEREERYKRARKRYQEMKRKEAEENERYYQSITTGKKWLGFRIVVIACTLVSLLLTLDTLFFPTSFENGYIIKSNRHVEYSNIAGEATTPIILDNGKKTWVPIQVMYDGKKDGYTIEYTSLFKDIKSINLWDTDKWLSYTPDYSLMKTFPVIPLILLLPFFTFLIKKRTYTFIMFFNLGLYFMPIVLFVILLSNDRWFHLITFFYK